jgi:hypothetical protein
MRPGSNARRPRGRSHRRQGGGGGIPNKNQNFDSNGPEGRVRGTAHQVYEKYVGLARDAQSSGDRILSESFLQHAEHYFRIFNESMDPEQEAARRINGHDAPTGREQPSHDAGDAGDQGESQEAQEGGRRGRGRRQGRYPGFRNHGNGAEEAQDLSQQPQPEVSPPEQAAGSADASGAASPEVKSSGPEAAEAPQPRRRGRPRKERSSEEEAGASEETVNSN